METDDMKVTDIEKIINAYYIAVSKSDIIKNNLVDKPDREFSQIEIDEILSESECIDDPYNVPFGYIINKYYEPEYIKNTMDKIHIPTIKITEALLIKHCKHYATINDITSTINRYYPTLNKLMSTHAGREAFTTYYNMNKDDIYLKAVQKMINMTYSEMIINPSHIYPYTNEMITDKIPYPMTDEFDLIKFVDDYKLLSRYFNTNKDDSDQFEFKRDDLSSLNCYGISLKEALSNFPSDMYNDIMDRAKHYMNMIKYSYNLNSRT